MWTPRSDASFSILLAEDGSPEGTPVTTGRLRAGGTYTLRTRVPRGAAQGAFDLHVFARDDEAGADPPASSLVEERARLEHGEWLVATFTLPQDLGGDCVRVGFVQARARRSYRPDDADGWGGDDLYAVEA